MFMRNEDTEVACNVKKRVCFAVVTDSLSVCSAALWA